MVFLIGLLVECVMSLNPYIHSIVHLPKIESKRLVYLLTIYWHFGTMICRYIVFMWYGLSIQFKFKYINRVLSAHIPYKSPLLIQLGKITLLNKSVTSSEFVCKFHSILNLPVISLHSIAIAGAFVSLPSNTLMMSARRRQLKTDYGINFVS